MYRKLPNGYLRISDGAIVPENAPGNPDWERLQAWLEQGNQPEIDINEVIAYKTAENTRQADRRLDLLTQGKNVAEIASWTPKAEEARQFQASKSLKGVPGLVAEVNARQPDLQPENLKDEIASLCQVILQKEQQLKEAAATIVGTRAKIQDEINRLTIENFDFNVVSRWDQLNS